MDGVTNGLRSRIALWACKVCRLCVGIYVIKPLYEEILVAL